MSARRADRWLSPLDLAQSIARPSEPPSDLWQVVGRLVARRREFGISRVGCVTGLDKIGIPVVQTVRPLSLSVSVNQGKGLTPDHAAISSLMESLEGWASERIAPERQAQASLGRADYPENWQHLLEKLPTGERERSLAWIEGWDLLNECVSSVPMGLVDTAYVVPSAYPHWMDRNTTGLAAGTSLHAALVHASLEVLERHARAQAMQTPHFFDRNQVQTSSVLHDKAATVISLLRGAGFDIGIWSIPYVEGVVAFWCQIMEGETLPPLAPLPASGFGCDLAEDVALTKALLEACQSRLGFISSAREDVTVEFYSEADHRMLSGWRDMFRASGRTYDPTPLPPMSDADRLAATLPALRASGARAAIAISLFADETVPLHVVRVVAPPLHSNPDKADGC